MNTAFLISKTQPIYTTDNNLQHLRRYIVNQHKQELTNNNEVFHVKFNIIELFLK